MRTVRTKVYKFKELKDQAKEKAMQKLWSINVDHEWWDFIYDDAKEIGLRITSFDIDRASYCNAELMLSPCEVAQNIFNQHGEDCETYKTAAEFMAAWQPIFDDYMDERSENYESGDLESQMIDLEDEFLKSLCGDYLTILRKEYEYLTSEEAILETIEANEYEFYQDGRMY